MSRPEVTDADLALLTTPTPPVPVTGDPFTDFIRMKMQEDGFFRLLFPAIPEGAPWWETGWRANYVVRQVRYRADGARQLAARRMNRDRWRAWYRDNRAGSRKRAGEVRFKRKLAENMAQLGRLAALVRAAGSGPA